MPCLGIPPSSEGEALLDGAGVAPISQKGTGEAGGGGPGISSSASVETRTVSMETGSPNLAQK